MCGEGGLSGIDVGRLNGGIIKENKGKNGEMCRAGRSRLAEIKRCKSHPNRRQGDILKGKSENEGMDKKS